TIINIYRSSFAENVNIAARKRLLSILVEARPTEIYLAFSEELFIDERFLIEYSKSVRLPRLTMCFQKGIELRPNELFKQFLSNFGSLTCEQIIIETTWLIPAIIFRLRAKSHGYWIFHISKEFTQVLINPYVEHDLKYTARDRDPIYEHLFELSGTPW
ncbi:hypothetical protein PMAYCL1PPCAC_25342, partial [Pristionchus mayeri]